MKNQPPMQGSMVEPKARMRITYSTDGAIRFAGNLDLHRVWERAFRRADLPISYSHGFHPQPKLQLASALPLGIFGRQELADIWLDEEIPADRLPGLLNQSLPGGVRVLHVEQVDLKEKPLQTRLKSAQYLITLYPSLPADHLSGEIGQLLAREEIIRERRGKIYNLRPLIEQLILESPAGDRAGFTSLQMTLSAREGATGRPEEVLAALGIDPQSARIERTTLTFD